MYCDALHVDCSRLLNSINTCHQTIITVNPRLKQVPCPLSTVRSHDEAIKFKDPTSLTIRDQSFFPWQDCGTVSIDATEIG